MAEIEELRQRVEAAQKRFGLLDEQQKHYSERLVGLMDVVDDGIRQQRAEADDLQGEVQKISRENDELKSMLQTLLLAMEEGSAASFADTMRTLESRAGALVEAAEATAALPGPVETAAMTSEAAPEPAADENAAADIPATPPTPWDDETAGDAKEEASAPESEPAPAEPNDDGTMADAVPDPEAAQTVAEAEDEEGDGEPIAVMAAGSDEPANDEADAPQTTSGSLAVEERVKRLIEMTEMPPSKTQS